MVDLVLKAADAREDPKIPREFVLEALEKIEAGEIEVERYPSGAPNLKAVYLIARRLRLKAMNSKPF